MHGAAEHVVAASFRFEPFEAGLLIAADDEDRVVGAGGDRQQRQLGWSVGEQSDQAQMCQQGNHSRAAAGSTATVTSMISMVVMDR